MATDATCYYLQYRSPRYGVGVVFLVLDGVVACCGLEILRVLLQDYVKLYTLDRLQRVAEAEYTCILGTAAVNNIE